MAAPSLRTLIDRLARSEERGAAAEALARRLGARRLLLLVKDPELGVLLPAAGMPKTLAGGPAWRDFLRRCLRETQPQGPVDLAGCEGCIAAGTADERGALVLVWPQTPSAPPPQLQESLPTLMALLGAQHGLQVMQAEAQAARESASRASALARALDSARSAAADLNQQLRTEHERKDEFLAMLAHELRNPLAPLVSAVEVLRRAGTADPALQDRQLELMHRQLRQMTRLIDDLLDLSRVSRGLVELRRKPHCIGAIIADAVEAVRPALDAGGHALTLSGGDEPAYVHADAARLTQVFTNLLHNAAKYTEPGGRIQVAVVRDVGRVSVVVRDNGVGIPQEMLGRVFDMFTQVPGPLDRAVGGLGIGLTLVRDLIERHGGTVSAYSQGLGRGSTFTVSLPLVRPPRAEPAPLPAAVADQPAAQPVRVMVVDDNRDAAESLADVLRLLGARAEVAHDGEYAIARAEREMPELVFLDIGLPRMDGYQTAREWRRRFGQRSRLVALTGYGSPHDRQLAADAGFDLHCVKPLGADAIVALLAEAEQSRAAAQLG